MVLLRCLTFNIWKNEGDFPRRIEAIGEVLATHQPDVVALQECFVAPALGIDTVLQLAGTGYHSARYQARTKARWHDGGWCDSRSDMALFTRHAPLQSGQRALASDARDGERGLLWVDVSLGLSRVRLGCTDFTHLQDAAARAVRGQQASGVIATLLQEADAAILLGDLNAVSDDPALAPIFQHDALCPVARSMAVVRGDTAPANGAIDHVLPFSMRRGARLIGRRRVSTPDASGFPSDHPAILADIDIT